MHEVSLSRKSDEKTASLLMVELGYALPTLGSVLEMELLTDQAGKLSLKHRLWVLIKTASLRRFFEYPKSIVLSIILEFYNFQLKLSLLLQFNEVVLMSTYTLMCYFKSLIMVFLRYFLFNLTVGKIFSLENSTLRQVEYLTAY